MQQRAYRVYIIYETKKESILLYLCAAYMRIYAAGGGDGREAPDEARSVYVLHYPRPWNIIKLWSWI